MFNAKTLVSNTRVRQCLSAKDAQPRPPQAQGLVESRLLQKCRDFLTLTLARIIPRISVFGLITDRFTDSAWQLQPSLIRAQLSQRQR
jgi:hypothetical protein